MVLLVIAVILTLFLYCFITKNKNYWKERNVAGPESLLFFGNFKQYVFGNKYLGDVYKEIYDQFPNEKIVGYYRMMTPVLLIRDPEIIKQILVQDFEVFPVRGVYFSKNKLGDNLLHADVETWKYLRSRFTSMFTLGKLKSMIPILINSSNKLLDYIEIHRLQNPEQEFHRIARNYAVSTAMACILDLNMDTFNDDNKLVDRIDSSVFTYSFTMLIEDVQPGTLAKFNMSLYPKVVQDFCKYITKFITDQKSGKGFINVISELLHKELASEESNNNKKVLNITEQLIAGQVFVFYVAGYVNTSILISAMLYQLALNTDIQNKLIEEIDTILSEYGGNITPEAIKDMVYLERAFKEIARMYTPSASILREAVRNYKIPGTNVTIKKGHSIIISPYAIHRDEKYYPEANKFDPDRFLSENMKKGHPYTYIPFGAGPRSCIGGRFAKIQTSVCIAKILSKYNVRVSDKTTPDIKYEPSRNVMYPRDGIYLKVVPRRGQR